MEKLSKILEEAGIFQGIKRAERSAMLCCLSAREQAYERNAVICQAGEEAQVGLVLSGEARVLTIDYWGSRSILAQVSPGELFGEAFSCKGGALPVHVVAAERSRILWLNYRKLLTTCTAACPFHGRLIQNMVEILAEKNRELTQKLEHVMKRTTREKLLSYLSAQALKAGSSRFTIPFNRQELADYLAVERSAMCHELSRMREDGLVEFSRNEFLLKNSETK